MGTLDDQISDLVRTLWGVCSALDSLKGSQATPPPARSVSKFKRLLFKDTWPKAVPDLCLCPPDSDDARHQRGLDILDALLEREIAGTRFLDLRCGTGDLPHAALQLGPGASVGYGDASQGWGRFSGTKGLVLTTSPDEIGDLGPYESVFLYDVLDRMVFPIPWLRLAGEHLAPDGLIYARVRPWSSRLGVGDLNVLNRAFCQLFLQDHELASLGVRSFPSQRVLRRETYRRWIEESGLSVRRERLVRHPVERVFQTPVLKTKLAELFGTQTFPEDEMSISYIDYTLVRPR